MGGFICNIGRNAILRFQSIPTSDTDLAQFDTQIRELMAHYSMDLVSDNTTTKVKLLCAVLAKPKFNTEDRQFMLSMVEALYEGHV